MNSANLFFLINKNRLFLNSLAKICEGLIEKNGLQEIIKIVKSNWLLSFEFFINKKVSFELKTLFLQELTKNKVLFQGFFAPCLSHGNKELHLFKRAFEKSLKVAAQAKIFGVKKYLKGEVIKPVFSKFN